MPAAPHGVKPKSTCRTNLSSGACTATGYEYALLMLNLVVVLLLAVVMLAAMALVRT